MKNPMRYSDLKQLLILGGATHTALQGLIHTIAELGPVHPATRASSGS